MHTEPTVVVIAKEPVPGRVKTRLTPPCTPEQAADLAEAALADTLDVVRRVPARRRVLALDGESGAWLPPGFDIVPQVSGTLDRRLAGVMSVVDGPMILVGMDTPQLSPELMSCDFDARPAWLGRAEDGGFWLLGLADPDPALVEGVPMSVSSTYSRQRERLESAGLAIGAVPPLRDVDTWSDAEAVAKAAPGTRFARRYVETLAAMGIGAETR
ncbi:MAG TPA: DUF2064 domain-containing protein [Actinopolymorphaceae bacterium]